jgi:hypothetical protein
MELDFRDPEAFIKVGIASAGRRVPVEYVVISYPTVRKVRIDGQDAGFTNDTLMVEAGNHLFDLGNPRDYQPGSVTKIVQGTTAIGPLIINDFHPS